jgi:hypothetical protein
VPGRPLRLLVLVAGAALAVSAAGCGDGRPAYCNDLAGVADMSALSSALESQDLGRAREAAQRFSELAGGAPDDIRSEMEDLADAVEAIVELLTADRNAVPGAGEDGQGDAADVERQRDELNRRLEDLATTSSRVERWAARECGVELH